METSPTNTYQFGISFRLDKKRATIKSGLFYSKKGDKYLHFNAFEIPVLLGIKPVQGRAGVAFYGGTYFSWWGRVLAGEAKHGPGNAGNTVLEKSHSLNHRSDLGIKFGMESYVTLPNEGKLTLGLFSSHGLKKFTYSGAGYQFKLLFRQLSFTLGYLMPL